MGVSFGLRSNEQEHFDPYWMEHDQIEINWMEKCSSKQAIHMVNGQWELCSMLIRTCWRLVNIVKAPFAEVSAVFDERERESKII